MIWLLLTMIGCERPKDHTLPAASAEAASVWTCPMHPSVRATAPGQCPICGMDLVLAGGGGGVHVDVTQQAQLGIAVEPAVLRPMYPVYSLPGVVAWDRARLAEVAARVDARVVRVHVRVGQQVRAGDPLLALAGPELATTLSDLRAARSEADSASASARLAQWGLTPGVGDEAVVRAPRAGVILTLETLAGANVSTGQTLVRMADPRGVTVEANLTEGVAVPTTARVRVAGQVLPGRVLVVEPEVDPITRTRRLVVALDTPAAPGSLVTVEIEGEGGEQVAVPSSAVLYTGPRRLVFVAEGDHYTPREVGVGAEIDGWTPVVSGLSVGELVVTKGTFLVAADSRLREVGSPQPTTQEAP